MGIVKKPSFIFFPTLGWWLAPGSEKKVGKIGGGRLALEVVGERCGDAVVAGAEDQGVARAPAEALDLADEEHVVAALERALEAAFEQREAIGQRRAAAEALLPGDGCELVGVRAREVVRDVALVGGQAR